MLFYDFPDAYDLFYTDDFREHSQEFYKNIFGNHRIKDVLDCAVGTGQLSLPFCKMGYNLIGSDENNHMLRKARENFAAENFYPQLLKSSFLELSTNIKRKFDLVACTGNSLPHVKNENIKEALLQMDSLLKPGGYLYFDTRNWDLVLKRQQRFYLFNPIIRDKGRVNYIQVWDYNRDGSMTFNFLIFEEIDNKIVSKRQFFVLYYPFTTQFILDILKEMNYQNVRVFKLGDHTQTNIEDIDWLAIMAEKPAAELMNLKKQNKRKGLFF